MSPEAKKFFDGMGGNPTAGEVVLVESALLAGKAGVALKFARTFDEAMRLRYRRDHMAREDSYVCTNEDVRAAFDLAKKAVGL